MKKKIAVITPSLRGGGAEKVMVNIIKNIDKKKFDIFFIVLDYDGPYIKEIPQDVEVINLDTKRVRKSIKKLIKKLNEIEPDIVFSTLGYLNLGVLAIKDMLKNKPKIVIREANNPSNTLSQFSVFKKIIYKEAYKRLYPKADMIISQCQDMKQDLIDFIPLDHGKITYIYNPVDVVKIKNTISSNNPYDSTKINYLAVGRLSYQKGFDILLDSFTKVLNSQSNSRLTILGEGELKSQLISQAYELGIQSKVDFLGFVDNPYNYYYYSDVYVLSSRYEGFPNALLEALACDAKVVATNCKSGPREILRNNQYGLLVKTEDVEELAKGMLQETKNENRSNNRAYDFRVEKNNWVL